MSTPTGIVGITTSGIQDISGFLPILGTEQCEEHVTCALERGFFYAAGAPMSIFGSLGIIKAGFTTVWVSLDTSWFHGPRQMRNAGFVPKGVMGKLAYALDTDDSIYNAEALMRSILHRYRTFEVDLNLLCWPWLRWNLLNLLFGIGFGSLGLLPYVYIIVVDFRDRPFSESWLYPVLRIYGYVLVATMIQLVVQLRILFVVHSRLRFHVLNSWFQEKGNLPPVFWDVDTRSEECLSRLGGDIAHSKGQSCDEYFSGLETSVAATCSMTSFNKVVKIRAGNKWNCLYWPSLPSLLLTLCRFFLVGGIIAAGVGYMGCFGLVQASNTTIKGPGIWLAVEVILSIIRLMIWASNPSFDDPPPPITISRADRDTGRTVRYDIGWMLPIVDSDVTVNNVHAVVIGVGSLRRQDSFPLLQSAVKDAASVAAYLRDDLTVPNHQIASIFNEAATSTAIKAALRKLATDNSIQPRAPIIIYFSGYLVERSQHTLTFVTSEYNWTEPYTGLLYTEILDLLQTISISKGNNITVILDTTYRPSLGAERYLFDSNRETEAVMSGISRASIEFLTGHQSHVLLAACSGETAKETEGGVFTRLLLQQLRSTDARLASTSVRMRIKRALFKCLRRPHASSTSEKDIRGLTYRGLVQNISDDPSITRTSLRPLCSANLQNRLLFNGLLANSRLATATSNPSIILISSDAYMKEEEVVSATR